MNKKLFKKSFAGFMVLTVFLWPIGPILSSPKTSRTASKDALFKKVQTEQTQNFSNKNNVKQFSSDNFQNTKNTKKKQKLNYVPGEVLVKFKKRNINLERFAGRMKAEQFAAGKNLDKKEYIKKSNISILKTKADESVEGMVKRLKNDPNVEYVEPNYKRYPAAINTNDTWKEKLWGLDNTGQEVNGIFGTPHADIDAPEAWAISDGSENKVIVAVIDKGVAYNHPDLLANMWDGSNCVDENGNALGGCNHGYDYEDGDKTPLPTNSSHGTHIAGTIGAVKNNNKGVIGVAPNVKIMAIKFGFTVSSEVKAIDFAIQNGAKVINASFGNNSFSQSEYDAINRFKQAGGIFIAAAGNDANNNDGGTHFYPADYNLNNIISVAATDQNDDLASFSDYGVTSVDVGAPGVNIYSTGGYRFFDEDFESVVPPDIGTKFTQVGSSTWGTISNGSN